MTGPLLVHAGLHKTGTTWLQDRVFRAKDSGEIAFDGDLDRIYGTFIVPDIDAFDPGAAGEAFAPLLARADGRLAVISGEALAGRPFHSKFFREVTAGRLAETFPDATVLLTIREQRAVVYSMHGQYVRFGWSASLAQFLAEPPVGSSHHPILDRRFYDYERLLDLYERHFPGRVLMVPFEAMVADPDAFVARVAKATGAGLSPIGAETGQRMSNPAWSDLAYDTMRQLNRLVAQDARWARRGGINVNAWGNRIDRITPKGLRRRMATERRALVDRALGDTYARSNARVAKRIGYDLGALGYRTG